jgi:hypothetical protein
MPHNNLCPIVPVECPHSQAGECVVPELEAKNCPLNSLEDAAACEEAYR